MELGLHYTGYKLSLQKDALPGWVEFCSKQPTKKPEAYPVVKDYLLRVVTNIKKAIEANDEASYRKWLACHRDILVQVFNKMGKDKDVLSLGWNWYKFSDLVIEYKDFTQIPRYCVKYTNQGVEPFFDADEIALAVTNGSSWARGAIDLKNTGYPPVKVLDGKMNYKPIDKLGEWYV